MTQASTDPPGLREHKRARTRETIVSSALTLFAERGYQGTTLTQIADAAEVAPSTLHAYFRSKDDILFSFQDAARESVRERVLERPVGEALGQAIEAWITEVLPGLPGADSETLVRQRKIIELDDWLVNARRLRRAQLEDTFAEVFAAGSGASPDDLHPRLMASVVANSLFTIWQWWYTHRAVSDFDAGELYSLDATYLTRLIAAAENVLRAIPAPPQQPGPRRSRG